ncbi:MAG: type II secretion system protein GspM [Gammaproteobacteria bacterium]
MGKVKQLMARIDELTLRERVIVMASVLLVLILSWYTYLMEPLMKEEKQLISALDTKRGQLQGLNDQFLKMTRASERDPDRMNREELKNLRGQVAQIKQDIKNTAAHLVPPESMPDVLRMVLNKSKGLTLLKLNGLGSTPLIAPAKDDKAGKKAATAGTQVNNELGSAFKHGMRIEVTGSFFETLDYLHALEKLERGFFWDQVSFEVKEYPDATVTITLYTLSLNSNWIGI